MIKIDKFNAVALEEYNGKWSAVLGFENKAGDFSPKWSKQEFGKDNWKNIPVKVPLGDREQAITILQAWLAELEYDEVNLPDEDADIPF